MKRRSAWVLLGVFVLAAASAWAVTVTWTPPAQVGDVYTVIDYRRSFGTTQATSVSVAWGTFNKSATISAPLDSCSQAVHSGFVLKLRHLKADSIPLTLTTNGTILMGPYQGSAPAQWSAPCYKRIQW